MPCIFSNTKFLVKKISGYKTILMALIILGVSPVQAALLGFQLNFNVTSGSTTLGGKIVDSLNPFTGMFTFDSDNLIQPVTTVAQNQFLIDFTIDGMTFSATNSLASIEIQKLFGTQPNEITRLRNGLVTLNGNTNDFISFSNTGSPPTFSAANGINSVSGNYTITSLGVVPLPGTAILFVSALAGLFTFKRKYVG